MQINHKEVNRWKENLIVEQLSVEEKEAIFELAQKIALGHKIGQKITGSEMAKDIFINYFAGKPVEEFVVAFIDSQHQIIDVKSLFSGTINACSVYPREVLKHALRCDAAAIILSHNHPSGILEPSSGDKEITMAVSKACDLLSINVLDHIIVGKDKSYSFAVHGLM